jgi:hypothetical protein
MIEAETMLHTRTSIIRAFQDRMKANQTLTVAVPNLEDGFAARHVGYPAVRLYPQTPASCGWELFLDVGGPSVQRTYAVTFWDGNGMNLDQSLVNAGFVSTAANLATRTGNQTFFVASPAGTFGHTPNDGHYHGFRVRFEDGPIIHDYYKAWTPDYFCEEQPCWGQCLSVVGTAGWGLPPSKLTVRQAVRLSVGPSVELRGGAPSSRAGRAGLATEVARSGVMSIEYGVPVGVRGEATIRIYDLRGRLVRTMRPGTGAGWASLTWDGLNDAGGAASPGVYLAVVSAGEQQARTKLIVPAR